MTENKKLDLMKKFKELNVAEYTTKYGDYYGLMFAGAEIATKDLQKENAELKADNDARKFAMVMSEKVEKQLREENAELKETVIKMNDVITKSFGNLTKAKELLKQLLVHSKRYLWIADDYNKKIMQKEIAEAEQFISEVDK